MENNNFLNQFPHEIVHGTVETVRTLLDRKPGGISIDAKDETTYFPGKSALEYCTSKFSEDPTERNTEMVKLLLQYGANPLQKIEGCHYVLLYLVFLTFDSEMTIEFLKQVEDIEAILNTKMNADALEMSLIFGNVRVLKYCLKRNADPNRNDKECKPIFLAVSSDTNIRLQMVATLLDHGANINLRTDMGFTPLHIVLTAEDGEEITDFLLEKGADVNLTDDAGMTPLHLYLLEEKINQSMVEKLLKFGSDPNILENKGQNSLHYIAASTSAASVEVCEMLIRYGASVNHGDRFRNTPLHLAIFTRSTKLISILLTNGADVRLKNNQGLTPISYLHACQKHKRVALVVMRHIIFQVHLKKLEIPSGISEFIESCSVMKEIGQECENELKCMEKSIIENTNVSSFEVLSSDSKKVARFARNIETARVLSEYSRTDYAHYGVAIKKAISAGLVRRRLEDKGFSFFSVSNCNKLPLLILQKIIDTLSNSDLENLEKAMDG